VKLAHRSITVSLTEPFASNKGLLTEVHQHVVTLSWQGLTGFGSALGANDDELADCAELIAGTTPYALRQTLSRLDSAGVRPAVRAAVDMALYDLLGKAAGQPLHRLLGLAGLALRPTGLSIGACPDDMLARHGARLARWPILKLKMTADDDGSHVGLLRAVYPGRIWVDGNGSWNPRRAVQVAHELHRYAVELLEQPVAAGSLEDLRYVHQRSPIPVIADEGCVGPADVLRLCGQAGGINIKLTKCGGLQAAQEMIALARHAGLRVMLGCKTESALAVTAMAQLGGLADYLDLDGHLHLRNDPFLGAEVREGRILMPDRPGLGAIDSRKES
jgi:L-Ala-D/L-Glu epimerase